MLRSRQTEVHVAVITANLNLDKRSTTTLFFTGMCSTWIDILYIAEIDYILLAHNSSGLS